jgi:hypothetical protein
LTLRVATQLLRSAHGLITVMTCAKLCEKNQWFKSYEADTKCRFFIMTLRLFNILPLSVTLTLGVETQSLRLAHRLIMVITCAKSFNEMFSNLKVMERTRKCYGRTDGSSNGTVIMWLLYCSLYCSF